VEVIVSSVIFVLMLVGLVGMTISAVNQWSFGSSKVLADNDAVLAMQLLSNEVRSGIRAYTDTSGGTLSVVIPTVNSQGDYDRFTEGATVRYYVSNSKLMRQQGVATATVLAKKINSVVFAVNGSQVDIQANSRQQSGTKIGDTTLKTQVNLRNQPLP
jgi:hypothetical protein